MKSTALPVIRKRSEELKRATPETTSEAQLNQRTLAEAENYLPPKRPFFSSFTGIKGKILAPAILMLVASLGAIYFVVQDKAKDLQNMRLFALAAGADAVQDKIDRCLFERYGDVQASTNNAIVRRPLTNLSEAERAELRETINRYITNSCYTLSFVVDPTGKVLAANTVDYNGHDLPKAAALVGRNLSDRAWFKKAVAKEYTTGKAEDGSALLTGTVVESPAKNDLVAETYGDKAPDWTMTFTAPIVVSVGGKDEVVGYWHNCFFPGMLKTVLSDEYDNAKKQGLTSTQITVIDAAGNLVLDIDPSSPASEAQYQKDVLKFNFYENSVDIAATAKNSKAGTGTDMGRNTRKSKERGYEYIQPGGFSRSSSVLGYVGSGFTVFMRADPDELFSMINTLKRTVLLVAGLALLIGTVILLFVSTPIVRAINAVKAGIAGVATGDLRAPSIKTPKDETREMVKALSDAVAGMREAVGNEVIEWSQVAKARQDSERLLSMVEESPTNIMLCEPEGNIVYANKASITTLKKLEKDLPCHAENVLGQSVDIFHKYTAQERDFLAKEGDNLPFSEIVSLGGEQVSLNISAVRNGQGDYLGAMLTWELVTEKLAAEKREKELTENLKTTLNTVSQNAQALASASEELSATSQQMSSNSEETSAQSNVVASAAEQVSKNVETVATSAEEMSASIREIAKNATEAARVATSAVKAAEDTNRTVGKLGQSSLEIGQVIKVITSIAQQTNLLALNATIEAARAGEAGKGFAVVANEVKELAKQTAAATEDISAKIEAIQGDTKNAVKAIGEIGSIIAQINDISNTIASAVEEQSATTNEIARNASEAAKGSTEISKNIVNVSLAAKNTSEGSNNCLSASNELARLANDLKRVVDLAKI